MALIESPSATSSDPQPTEVLIPEARARQRKRRGAVIGSVIIALVLAVSIVTAGGWWGSLLPGAVVGGSGGSVAVVPVSSATTAAANTYMPLVSCASSSNCMSLVANGGGNRALATGSGDTLLRLEGSTWRSLGLLDSNVSDINATSLSCPTSSFCAIAADPQHAWYPHASAFVGTWSNGTFTAQPSPQLQWPDLTSVSCVSPTFCVAVGWSMRNGINVPLAETWNGSNWSLMPQPVGNPPGMLAAVSCTSRSFCMAIGEDSGPYAQTWDGTTWRATSQPPHTSPPPPHGIRLGIVTPTPRLTAVSCSGATSCVVTGELVGSALAWNGSSWTMLQLPHGGASPVSCSVGGPCFAVSTTSVNSARYYVQSLSGTQHADVGVSDSVNTRYWGISCPQSSACVVVGNHGTTATSARWDGHRWSALQFSAG